MMQCEYFPSLQPNQKTCIQTRKQAASLWNKPNKAAAWKHLLHRSPEAKEKSITCYSLSQNNSAQKITGPVKICTGYTDKKENPHQTMEFITNTNVNREIFH
jgi:hypothetical protein